MKTKLTKTDQIVLTPDSPLDRFRLGMIYLLIPFAEATTTIGNALPHDVESVTFDLESLVEALTERMVLK